MTNEFLDTFQEAAESTREKKERKIAQERGGGRGRGKGSGGGGGRKGGNDELATVLFS